MYSKFQIYKTQTSGEFYYRLLNTNGFNLGYSEGYKSKAGAENGIHSVRINSHDGRNFTVFKGANNQYYYHLKAGNGEIVLRSTDYPTEQQAVNVAREVMHYAPTAMVEDLTIAKRA